jgi:hypothetical protein
MKTPLKMEMYYVREYTPTCQWIYFQMFPSQTSSFYGYYILWLGIHTANNFTVCDK